MMIMKTKFFGLAFLLYVLTLGFVSCGDDDEEDYWRWQNEAYIDSIAAIVNANPTPAGWAKYQNYKVDPAFSSMPLTNNDYVYVKSLEQQDVLGITPSFNDTVYVYYTGRYIDESSVDGNYSGDFDIDVTPKRFDPTPYVVKNLIPGWTTALLHMREGERVQLFIPYLMAYGAYGDNGIPGYSTLVFDVYLDHVVHPEGPDDRSMEAEE